MAQSPIKSVSQDTTEEDLKFYNRPSVGLKVWGPLVPASDNKFALYSLLSFQTAVGFLCLKRFRSIKPLPSLHRFSNKSSRFAFSKYIYLTVGSLFISQSLLEGARLSIFKYDPWEEEMKSVRQKAVFNNVIKFYHKNIDPTKFKIKDMSNGNLLSINSPQVKQSIALINAQNEANHPLIRYFGPIEYKPMSFSEYLDRVQYYLEALDSIKDSDTFNFESSQLRKQLILSDEEQRNIIKNNEKIYQDILENDVDSNVSTISVNQNRNVIMGPHRNELETLDFDDIWSVYNPWSALQLDTSLSIKFLPTVINSENNKLDEIEEENTDMMTILPSGNDDDPKNNDQST